MGLETRDTSAPRIHPLPKLVRFALTVLIATALGPLIGSVVVVIATRLLQSPFSAAAWADESGVLIVILGYTMGWLIAFVAGTIVAVAALTRQPTFATIIVANVGCEVALQDDIHPYRFFFNLAVSIFAASICWLLFRRRLSSP